MLSENQNRYVDTGELERLTGIKRRTWDKWRYLGTGPRFLRVSRRMCRYRLGDVLAWLESKGQCQD
jgi:predicted DNA-binding transcriptional regulator AlpA